jgi:indolepyruvate ferredoxin oxidoreductase alpha subunit
MMEGPPFRLGDFKICMGAGIGVAQGVSRKIHETPVIAVIGDSTLFHAGLPAVLNAAYYDANVLFLVCDNRWTAMTGHQPTPSTEQTTEGETLKNVDIAKLLRALGIKWVKKVNPFKLRKVEAAIKEGLKKPGFKAIVLEGECALQNARRNTILKTEPKAIYHIDAEKCKMCDICFVDFGCPAIVIRQVEDGPNTYEIDSGLCTQCGACVNVCPSSAIVASPRGSEKDEAL